MRTKYDQNKFAIYKGKIYSAYIKEGFIRLRSYDIKDVEENGFEEYFSTIYSSELKCIKDVSPYDVTEYYEQRFEAKYKGKKVGIMEGDDNEVNIQPDPTDITCEELLKLGFEQVEKGVYEKTLPTSDLTDIHPIKKNLLDYAKQDFDEINKSKK